MSARRDPLAAVARVRRVRERDSRLGLAQAVRELDQAQAHLEGLQSHLRLGGPEPVAPTSPGAFVARRTGFVQLHTRVVEARTSVDSAASIAASATAHWTSDRSRLEAIELLQERRLEEHRAGVRRSEAAALDEVATQTWARHRAARPTTPSTPSTAGGAA